MNYVLFFTNFIFFSIPTITYNAAAKKRKIELNQHSFEEKSAIKKT